MGYGILPEGVGVGVVNLTDSPPQNAPALSVIPLLLLTTTTTGDLGGGKE